MHIESVAVAEVAEPLENGVVLKVCEDFCIVISHLCHSSFVLHFLTVKPGDALTSFQLLLQSQPIQVQVVAKLLDYPPCLSSGLVPFSRVQSIITPISSPYFFIAIAHFARLVGLTEGQFTSSSRSDSESVSSSGSESS